jgi:DNA-binding transcriptional MerR regulator
MGAEANTSQLKVGELARRTGLTVRTLHHYDEIGLLKPSGRSESGYRLYSAEDVARLHGIQALRAFGLALNDIAEVLDGPDAAPQAILRRQLEDLDRQIEQARELRAKLALIQDDLVKGEQPSAADWLQALSLMTTFGKYFSAGELRTIFDGWRSVEGEWQPLLGRMRAAMDAGIAHDSPEIQPLLREWMSVVHRALDGDFSLMNRWGEMYDREPLAHGRHGAPPSDMLAFTRKGIEVRMQLLLKHMSMEDIGRCRPIAESRWLAIQDEARSLMAQGEAPGSPAARALASRWFAMFQEVACGDAELLGKVMRAHQQEPLLRAGSPIQPEVRDWLMRSLGAIA